MRFVALASSLIGVLSISGTCLGQTTGDWPMYNHDVRGWRFNSAETILSPGNVGQLEEKWRFPAEDSSETIGAVHATPTVVNGEVYFGTATFPAFYKLDSSGNLKCGHDAVHRRQVLCGG